MNELEIVRHEKIRGLTMFLNTVSYRMAHEHPEWELIWVLEHPLVVSFHADQYVLQPGQMVLLCPNELHALGKLQQNSTFLCLQIAPGILPISAHQMLQEHFPHRILSPQQLYELKRQIYAISTRYFALNQTDALYCLGQSILVLHQLLQALPVRELTPAELSFIRKRNARIKRLVRFVDENYMHKIRLSDFARQEGCSLSHLSRLIKEQTHLSFQEYVTYVRFLNACKMIAAGATRMLDVCTESGFSDYRYFTKAFRQQLNITPEEYARSIRAGETRLPELHSRDNPWEEILPVQESLARIRQLVGQGALTDCHPENNRGTAPERGTI